MYMKVFKCTSIKLFIFTILIKFYYGNCLHKHNLICVSLILMQNCQNGLVFVNFILKLLLGC